MLRKKISIVTAAVVLLCVGLMLYSLNVNLDGSNVVWADVTTSFGQINHFHFYSLTSKDHQITAPSEGWYAHQRLHRLSDQPQVKWYDDGEYLKAYDEHNNLVVLSQSNLKQSFTPFSALNLGIEFLSADLFKDKVPETVGDFLIYDFPPAQEYRDWLDHISVTVGKESLLPIQIKIFSKSSYPEEEYTLIVFDYDEPEMPLSFFSPPTQTLPPHGRGLIRLGGDEVEIEIKGAPGIQKAIARLHTQFQGRIEDLLIPYRSRYEIAGTDLYFMDITFVTTEGFKSITAEKVPLWINQGAKCALGKKGNWPDDLYRNIRYTPVLKPTDKDNEFILEISCWLRVQHPFL